jgi:RES domain-containing protein
VRIQQVCYRAHDPRWAFLPLSGDGASAKGGRFNAKGVPALYLSLSVVGALIEMGHSFGHRLDPLTMCSYDVDVEDIIDLTAAPERSMHAVRLADMACPWAYDLAKRRTPASWTLAQRLRSGGAAGILVPSFARGAKPEIVNLVLWRWGPDLPRRVAVHDPGGRLPKNQLSWS